jgi:hypothetical protein
MFQLLQCLLTLLVECFDLKTTTFILGNEIAVILKIVKTSNLRSLDVPSLLLDMLYIAFHLIMQNSLSPSGVSKFGMLSVRVPLIGFHDLFGLSNAILPSFPFMGCSRIRSNITH